MKPAAAHGTPRQGPGRAKPDRLSDEQFQETLQKLAARRFHLSEDNQDYLKGILKGILDDVSRGPANLDFAIVNVETALQSYAVLDHVYSNLARPSAIAAEATGLLSATHGLLAVLRKLHAVTVHEVTEFTDERLLGRPRCGFPDPDSPNGRWLETLTDLLSRIEESSAAVATHHKPSESRGRSQNYALQEVVRSLCGIFDEFYSSQTKKPPKRMDPRRLDFVLAALEAGSIPHPESDERFARDYLPKPGDN